ncbi:MAG: WD40 repeat domain-containing protein [Aggregatilineales bacterium]
MRKLIMLAVMALMLLATALAQDDSNSPAFVETVRFGRGDILHAEWHPEGDRFLVDTVRGAWIYGYHPIHNRFANLAYFEDARAVRYSPDGRTIAAILPDNSIGVWDAYNHVPSESPTFPIVHNTEIISIAWNPQSTHIASVDYDGRLLVWDVEARELAFAPEIENVWNYAWSTAGTYLGAINSETYELLIWDTEDTPIFQTTIERETFRLSANSLIWRNDSEVYQYSWGDMTTGIVWDVTTGEPTQQFTPYGSTIDLGYSPDSSRLAVGGYVNTLVYDADSLTTLYEIDTGSWNRIDWSPDSSKLAVSNSFIWGEGGSYPMVIVDSETGEVLQEITLSRAIRSLAWHPNNDTYLVVDQANEISVYQENNRIWSIEHTDIGGTLAWNNDGNLILAADTKYGTRLWDTNTGEVLDSRVHQLGIPTNIIWQPNGNLVAASSQLSPIIITSGTEVYVWEHSENVDGNGHDMTPIMIIPLHTEASGIAWSPDGSTLAIAEEGSYIRLWQPEDPSIIRALDYNRPYGMAHGIEWSTDGSSVSIPFSSSGNGGIVLSYDVESGEITNDSAQRYASDWVWTSDNRLIWANWGSYGCGGAPPVYTYITLGGDSFLSEDQCPPTLNGLSEQVTNGVFSPSGALLIGMDAANNTIIWDVETQQILTELDAEQVSARDALWSPDESLLVISSQNGAQHIVDVASGDVLFTFPRHRAGIVYWSPDSQQIALLSQGVVFIYDRP